MYSPVANPVNRLVIFDEILHGQRMYYWGVHATDSMGAYQEACGVRSAIHSPDERDKMKTVRTQVEVSRYAEHLLRKQ